eukprot:7017000-Ditylum_brightwellii.AAC.1
MTMIDPETSRFEIALVQFNKPSAAASDIFNNNWLCRYPRLRKIIYDNGSEFKKEFKQLCKYFGLKPKPTTEFEKMSFTEDDPWREVLPSTAWAICSTYHTMLGAIPGQLVYGRDMLHDAKHATDWDLIRLHKQKIIDYSTARENAKHICHDYATAYKVLINKDGIACKPYPLMEGPYIILQVYTNGTVKIQRGS